MGFKRGPFRLLRSYKRQEENKSKTRQERSSMQQADYHRHRPTPWMQESVSMHKSPTPVRHSRMNQARSEEEKKKRDRKYRCQEADGKKGSPTKEKHIRGTKTRPTQAQLRLAKLGEERLTSSSHRIWPPTPSIIINLKLKQCNIIYIYKYIDIY